ncbi:MAG: amidohydrolase family protein, partial [Pseudomonadota bacterium]
MSLLRVLGLVAAILTLGAAPVPVETQRFVVINNGEVVGKLVAQVRTDGADIDFAINENGRGPKAQEQIVFGRSGLPTSWTITGSSLFGNPVKESYSWADGVSRWESQADRGEVPTDRPRLYIASDASPWMLGVYVQALLKAPNRSLPVLPSGQLRLDEVRKITLDLNGRPVPLTVYALTGVTLEPTYVLVDKRGALYGALAGGLIREGAEGLVKQLAPIERDIALVRAREAQRTLAHRFDGPVRIRNVRIFDPKTMKLGALSSVVVYGDRITAVEAEQPGASAPAGETVIDGEGGTLVAGLHDMHSHTSLNSNLFNLAAGVTATRDQGNDNEQLLGWEKLMLAGELAGPRIVRNGLLEGRSPYSLRLGRLPETLEEGLADVRWYADHGYWQIKIYNSMNPDWVAPLAAEAHRLGMGVTGHVPAFSSPDRVMRDGYNDIAHVNQLMLGWILKPGEDTRTPLRLTGMARGKDLDLTSGPVQATIRLMKEKDVKLDTTAMILERLMLARSGRVQPADVAYLDHMPVAYQRSRKRGFVTIRTPQDDADYQAGFAKVLQVLKLLDDSGVQLLPSTDDGSGFALHRELELYVKAGISPGRTLRLATLEPEIYFGRDSQLGSIERGKLADLILVPGDPT